MSTLQVIAQNTGHKTSPIASVIQILPLLENVNLKVRLKNVSANYECASDSAHRRK